MDTSRSSGSFPDLIIIDRSRRPDCSQLITVSDYCGPRDRSGYRLHDAPHHLSHHRTDYRLTVTVSLSFILYLIHTSWRNRIWSCTQSKAVAVINHLMMGSNLNHQSDYPFYHDSNKSLDYQLFYTTHRRSELPIKLAAQITLRRNHVEKMLVPWLVGRTLTTDTW